MSPEDCVWNLRIGPGTVTHTCNVISATWEVEIRRLSVPRQKLLSKEAGYGDTPL
jgi:hypothetical protein